MKKAVFILAILLLPLVFQFGESEHFDWRKPLWGAPEPQGLGSGEPFAASKGFWANSNKPQIKKAQFSVPEPSAQGSYDEESWPPDEEPDPLPVVNAEGYLENGWLIWEELMPENWDPASIFEELNIDEMEDDDPRVQQVIERFLQKWDQAPVNPEIDTKPIKIPGFVVPLDFESEKVDEFFLVPFFGACIHVPPPPPNQIVMVRLKEPLEGLGAMEVVWVFGKIKVDKVKTEIGNSGYSLFADKVEFYQEQQVE